MLEVVPALGRLFTESDDRPNAAPVVLISESLWRSRLGADPLVVGRRLDVDGVTREIVGVMSASFRFPAATTALWMPLQLDPLNPPATAFSYPAVARLKPGVTIEDAEREFVAALSHAPEIVPKFVSGITTQQILDQVHPRPVLRPLKDDVTGEVAGTLWMVAAAAALLFLVACANVANLTLVRADARQREVAIREALGAARGRVLMHLLAEAGALAAVSTALGLAAATAAVRLLVGASPAGLPRLAEIKIDAGVIIFTLVIAALVTMVCALVPAMRLRGTRVGLREGARGATTGRAQHRLRGALVAVQIALALVVLAASGLLGRTVVQLRAVRPGFNPTGVSTFWISLPAARYATGASIVAFYSRLVGRVAALPGVVSAGLTSRLPLESHGQDPNPLYPEDDPSYATKLPPLQLQTAVTGEYFRTMGIPLLSGKTFDRMDAQREGDAVISISTARFFWKDPTGAAAIGRRFRPLPTGRLYTVVGVVGDVRDVSLADPASQVAYFPEVVEEGGRALETKRTLALVVRSGGEPALIADAVRGVVRNLDPALPVFDVRSLSAVVDEATAELRFVIALLAGATMVTLVLGAVGLYGVLAYVVTLRRREIGIRLALGASPRRVAAALARYGLGLAGAGIAAGLVLFVLVARFLHAWLFGVAAHDPVTLGASVITLLTIALLASWLPARRAARVDPAEALRAE